MVFFLRAANITNQIFKLRPARSIDVQVVGRNAAANYQIAQRLQTQMARIPGAADVHIHQVVDYPEIRLAVDRSKAGLVGLTQRDVSGSLLISLSSSSQVSPTPMARLEYRRQLQRVRADAAIPHRFARRADANAAHQPHRRHPLDWQPRDHERRGATARNLAEVSRGVAPEIVNHYNVQPVYDVYANVDRRDLGAVGSAVEKIVQQAFPQPAAGHHSRPARPGDHHGVLVLSGWVWG